MTTFLELLFQNKYNNINIFQKYDEEGYPVEDGDNYEENDDDLDALYDENYDEENKDSKLE